MARTVHHFADFPSWASLTTGPHTMVIPRLGRHSHSVVTGVQKNHWSPRCTNLFVGTICHFIQFVRSYPWLLIRSPCTPYNERSQGARPPTFCHPIHLTTAALSPFYDPAILRLATWFYVHGAFCDLLRVRQCHISALHAFFLAYTELAFDSLFFLFFFSSLCLCTYFRRGEELYPNNCWTEICLGTLCPADHLCTLSMFLTRATIRSVWVFAQPRSLIMFLIPLFIHIFVLWPLVLG